MNKPFKVQLAIQGGGAKICALLAAAEAIQQLEEEGKIQVTRLAGTSAGALTACLLATGKPIQKIKQRLIDRGEQDLKKLFPEMRTWRKYWRILTGEPLYNISSLRELLTEYFGNEFVTFENLKLPVFVVAADIVSGDKKVYKSADDKIIEALINSCALPYVFRAPRNINGSAIVDGGICENLPSDELAGDVKRYGEIIGIALEPTAASVPPWNVIDFSKALLNTAINNSVSRARLSLAEGKVFTIPTDVDTFDWKKAIGDGLGLNHYERVKLETEKWFNGLLHVLQEEAEFLIGDPWGTNSDVVSGIMENCCW